MPPLSSACQADHQRGQESENFRQIYVCVRHIELREKQEDGQKGHAGG